MEIDVIREVALRAAKEAGAILRQGLERARTIQYKGVKNIVTDVDRRSEEAIAALVHRELPDHSLVSEEGTRLEGDSGYRWFVDPLDGTTNYAHGYPLFCTSIALEQKGEIVMGVVYEPNHDELFTAEKEKGSFLNGKRIRVSSGEKIGHSLLATGFAYDIKKNSRDTLDHFKNMLLSAQAVRRDGVAAVDLCYTACGRYDGFWEVNLFPWDVGAGYLIVREAGGCVTDFSGKPFSVYAKEILATNGRIHEQMTTILKKSKLSP